MERGAFAKQLWGFYGLVMLGFAMVLGLIAWLESIGLPKGWTGYSFIFITIALYAVIGLMSRTTDAEEYYVASRRVPAVFNGMATGADWMSAATFIGMAGSLYFLGFEGLAYIIGWTGGYVLVALFVAPYLRRMHVFTVSDYFAKLYPGHNEGRSVRFVSVVATLICSFVYLVAQIYGVGLIASRFTGVEFGIGVFLGLAGILVCSFLGGMKAVTWTQVFQYIIMMIAFLVPVSLLSMERTGNLLPMFSYGSLFKDIRQAEQHITNDPAEIAVRKVFAQRADALNQQLENLPDSFTNGLRERKARIEELRRKAGSFSAIKLAEKELNQYPDSVADARTQWAAERQMAIDRSKPPQPHAKPFVPDENKSAWSKKLNFIALIFTLMAGTAALPHILIRYNTTVSVSATRWSVMWSLFFIVLLYMTAPALAVLVKDVIYTQLVGLPFANLPDWVAAWHKVDPALLTVTDINGDGILQLAEISIGADIITLATPEIAGLPYVFSGLMAAGGLAAALSTADGLLLTIANCLSHDLYYNLINQEATSQKRVTISKIILLIVALTAAWVTSLRPGNILYLVGAAFAMAASALFPALVMGLYSRRVSQSSVVWGMVVGLLVAVSYMAVGSSWFAVWLGMDVIRFFGIEPICAAVFGVPVGFFTIWALSRFNPEQAMREGALFETLHSPEPITESK